MLTAGRERGAAALSALWSGEVTAENAAKKIYKLSSDLINQSHH